MIQILMGNIKKLLAEKLFYLTQQQLDILDLPCLVEIQLTGLFICVK